VLFGRHFALPLYDRPWSVTKRYNFYLSLSFSEEYDSGKQSVSDEIQH